ncbi:hypothetical protein JOB18_010743 [Solea senegalensis]|uniref:Uncharacterized protein n=1 Tax=Solea senegalensis TaxID=28829 RepID=A0AAV6Q9M8_SOLSE|nr:hypothetical protein JOB18_010743 [Solea senegalensis]
MTVVGEEEPSIVPTSCVYDDVTDRKVAHRLCFPPQNLRPRSRSASEKRLRSVCWFHLSTKLKVVSSCFPGGQECVLPDAIDLS